MISEKWGKSNYMRSGKINWKVTEKSSSFIFWLPQHSWNLKSLSKKVLLLTDIDFPNPGKNTISWKRQVKGNGKHITFKKKMKEMWKSGSHFQVSGMWQSCNGLFFGIWVIIKCWIHRACVDLNLLLRLQIACIVGTKKRIRGKNCTMEEGFLLSPIPSSFSSPFEACHTG